MEFSPEKKTRNISQKTPRISNEAVKEFKVPLNQDSSIPRNVFGTPTPRINPEGEDVDDDVWDFGGLTADEMEQYMIHDPLEVRVPTPPAGRVPTPQKKAAAISPARKKSNSTGRKGQNKNAKTRRSASNVVNSRIQNILDKRDELFPEPTNLPAKITSISKKDLKRMPKAANPFEDLPEDIVDKIKA